MVDFLPNLFNLLYIVPSIFACITCSNFSKKYKGIVCTSDHDIEQIVKSLQCNDVLLINLDKEIKNKLNNDESQALPIQNMLLSSVYYDKCQSLLDNLVKLINTTNQYSSIILISKDYRLLKYATNKNIDILYTCATDNYRNTIKNTANFDDTLFGKIVYELKYRKISKLHVYNTYQELESIIMKQFNNLSRKF